jgi:hypothetical protein
VRVRERADDDVNSLTLENRSDLPLFVMAGEIVLGGKQDRIIGKDQIIPPRTTQAVTVYCVEQGRWAEEGGRQRGFRTANTLVHTRLRVSASSENQSEVWAEVADKNGRRRTQNASDTYRAVAQDRASAQLVQPYVGAIDQALAALPPGSQPLGFVVVMNGQLVGVDQFGSPRLFGKLRGKLARSYALQAVDLPEAPAATLAYRPSIADVNSFRAPAAAAPQEHVVTNGADGRSLSTSRKQTEDMVETEVKAAPEAPPVYKGTYRKDKKPPSRQQR